MNGNRTLKAALVGALSLALGTAVVGAEKRRDRTSSTPAAPSGAAAATVSPSSGFDAFQLVVERNIFNPNRVGRSKAAPEEKPPRIEEISLVGTMNYERGLVAFFDSPDSAFRKAVREGETIGDFKVTRITADGVELMRGDKPLALKVTEQIRRPEGGEWTVRTTPREVPSATGGGSMAARPTESKGPVEIPADASEVLKRLLKNRDKQLNK
jgi:hypothetical protein